MQQRFDPALASVALRQLGLVGGLEAVEDGLRAGWAGDAEVLFAELGHEFVPELGAALLEELGAEGELRGGGEVSAAPSAELGDDGDELDGGLGEAVEDLLLVGGVRGAGDGPGR